jgi:hypothetical protein
MSLEKQTKKEEKQKGFEKESNCKQSQKIFDNVYMQLKTAHYLNQDPKKATEYFIEQLKNGAKKHIEEIELKNINSQQIFQEIWFKMAEYINKYRNLEKFEEKKETVSNFYSQLVNHTNLLVTQHEVEPITAKVFLRNLISLKYIGHNYNDIVKNNENISAEELKNKNKDYSIAADKLWGQWKEGEKLEQDGGFYHFNTHLEGNVKNRIYVSAKLSESPDELINKWLESLKETGLTDKIYFKIPTGLSKRFESIIIYQTDKTKDSDIEKLINSFCLKCPEKILNENGMPTGIFLRPGISMAPEPSNINNFIRYSGSKEIISYNCLIDSLIKLSFELAYKESIKSGQENTTPKTLKSAAEKYFEQMIKLSGINPETMIPNSQNGRLPKWAENISKNNR